MDISESENSDIDATDDDWVADDVDAAEDDWVMSGKRRFKKRNSKAGNRSRGGSHRSENDSGRSETENLSDDIVAGKESVASGICCTCSKFSSCKTTKCQCRSARGFCGSSCGCVSTKCANREVNESLQSDGIDISEKNNLLSSQCAILLKSALVDRPEETNDNDEPRRKPLSDIGNTVAKTNAPKPNQRKKWHKSTIQLVTNPPSAPAPEQPENNEAPQKPDYNNVNVVEITVKLRRAMQSAASNEGNPFRDRNASQSDESSVNKDAGVVALRSPVRQNRTSQEKENFGV